MVDVMQMYANKTLHKTHDLFITITADNSEQARNGMIRQKFQKMRYGGTDKAAIIQSIFEISKRYLTAE